MACQACAPFAPGVGRAPGQGGAPGSPPDVPRRQHAIREGPGVGRGDQGIGGPVRAPSTCGGSAGAVRYAAPECESLLQACLAAGVAAPEPGYELIGQTNQIVAEAELAWEAQRLAVFLPGYEDDLKQFKATGWRVFQLGEVEAIIAAFQ